MRRYTSIVAAVIFMAGAVGLGVSAEAGPMPNAGVGLAARRLHWKRLNTAAMAVEAMAKAFHSGGWHGGLRSSIGWPA